MRTLLSKCLLLGIAATGLACITASALRAEIPPVLHADWSNIDKTYPTWVEAAAALGPDGRLDRTLFLPGYVEDLQKFLDGPPDPTAGCLAAGEVYDDEINPPDRSTPEKLVNTSAAVIVGVVTDRAFGFQLTVPGELLKIQVTQALPRAWGQEHAYVFVPVARFEVNGKVICKTDFNYAPPPATGEKVVLFLPAADDRQGTYVNLRFASSFATLSGENLVVSREVQPGNRGWLDSDQPHERRVPRARFGQVVSEKFQRELQW